MSGWLEAHTDISVSNPKEPGYYAKDLAMRNVGRGRDSYRQAFSNAGGARVLVDATPWYMFSEVAVPAILAEHPDARFVVMLRNPVDQVISLHRHHIRTGYEEEPDLMTALTGPRRTSPDDFRVGLDFVAQARFGSLVQRMLTVVAREQVLFVRFDQLRSQPRATYQRILQHMAVPVIELAEYDRRNAGVSVRFPALHRVLMAGKRSASPRLVRSAAHRLSLLNLRRQTEPVEQRVRDFLWGELQQEVALLEEVLGWSLDDWRPAGARLHGVPRRD